MSHRRPLVALVERPVSQAIEKHRRGPGENHAEQDKPEEPEGRPAVGRDEERAEREGQGENRMRKPDQAEEAGQAGFVRLKLSGQERSPSSRSRAEARIGVPCANKRRSNGQSSNRWSDRFISFWSEQYFAGSRLNP